MLPPPKMAKDPGAQVAGFSVYLVKTVIAGVLDVLLRKCIKGASL